jgi:urocanate hydratase
MTTLHRQLSAPRGDTISCNGWPQEAALRMLMNNLDPAIAERVDGRRDYAGLMLNALLNTCRDPTGVAVHHGGSVGIGYALHGGMVVAAAGADIDMPMGTPGRALR